MAAPGAVARMLTSPIGMTAKPRPQAGFTLIELLVVVSVLSVLALGVTLGTGGVFARASDSPRGVADRFALAMNAARDQAVLGRQRIGVIPLGAGWVVTEPDGGDGWRVVGQVVDDLPGGMRWRINGRPHLPSRSPDLSRQPLIVMVPDGRTTPFGADFGDIRCVSDGWTAVVCP